VAMLATLVYSAAGVLSVIGRLCETDFLLLDADWLVLVVWACSKPYK
jgi:hypothetical protein